MQIVALDWHGVVSSEWIAAELEDQPALRLELHGVASIDYIIYLALLGCDVAQSSNEPPSARYEQPSSWRRSGAVACSTYLASAQLRAVAVLRCQDE